MAKANAEHPKATGGCRVVVVDDDESELKWLVKTLREGGHEVVHQTTNSAAALGKIIECKPDCVVTDLMMPELDGLELCVLMRERRDLDHVKIVVVSGKIYEFDEMRARELGADAYVKKPLSKEAFLGRITKIMEDKIELRYWGVRGTLPVTGPHTYRYGGNTSCVTVSFPKDDLFIFDAGSGIRELGNHLMGRGKRISAKLFISHPHWDHINALPFFVPLYVTGNELEILGPAQANLGMRELVSAQMEGVYFPITTKEWGANVAYRDMREETIEYGDIAVHARLLSHPGYCLGYRIDYHGRSVCYVTDNELFLPDHEGYNAFYVKQLKKFVQGADILITDTTYTDEAYKSKVGWGHSCVSQVVNLAHEAEVKTLHLFHHDPSESDDQIDGKLDQAKAALTKLKSKTVVEAPTEGQLVHL